MLGGINQTEKDKSPYNITFMWNLKKNKLVKTEWNGGYQGLEGGRLREV